MTPLGLCTCAQSPWVAMTVSCWPKNTVVTIREFSSALARSLRLASLTNITAFIGMATWAWLLSKGL